MKIILTVLIVVCVLLSGFFSASEIVYSGVSKIKLKKKVEEGSKKAKAASKISDNFTDALSTILVDKADIKKALDDAVKRIG